MGVVSALIEVGYFVPIGAPGFHVEFGVGLWAWENGLANDPDAFRGEFLQLEGVEQLGPIVRVLAPHGEAVFMTNHPAIGVGALVTSSKMTIAWRLP